MIHPDWSDKNPELFEVIGNGVLTDLELVSFQNMGLYHSFNYKLQDTFSFEDFSDEEIEWVSDWLDWEYISLVLTQQDNSFTYHYFENKDNFAKDYKDALQELTEEKGSRFCFPLLLPNIFNTTNENINLALRNQNKNRVKEILRSINEDYIG